MLKSKPPQQLSATWQIKVTAAEKARVESLAEKAGWVGHTAWLRDRLRLAVNVSMGAADPTPDGPRLEIISLRLTPDDKAAIDAFARKHGISATSWARAVALTPDRKLKRL